MKISFRKIQFLFINASLFLFLQSCETLSEIPGKVLDTGSDAIDYVGSVFENETEDNEIRGTKDNSEVASSDEITENNQKNDVEVAVSKENEFLENSDQVLEAVPPEDLNVNPVKGIEEELATNQKEPTNNEEEQANKDKSSSVENFRSELDQQTFNYQDVKLESKLILQNKVQFKIATINFKSGSSLISSKDIKKIRKVIKIAADKNAQVRIVGHASTRTKDMSQLEHKLANFDISDKRSQAVAKVFVENKFPPSKLITEAVSDSKPLFHESMPAGTFGNQRTEIFIIY